MPSAASEQELSDLLIELWEFAQSDEFREICDNGLVCETYAGCSFHPSQVALPRALAEERLQEKKIANMHCTESIGLMLKFLVGFTQLNAAARRKAYKKHFAKYRADHMNQPKNYFRLYPLPPYSQFCTSKSKKNAGYGTLEVEYGILDKRHHLTSESKIQMSFEMAYLATIFGLVFSGETTVNGLQKWLGKHFACSQEKVYRCVMANKNDLHTIGWDPTTGIRTNHNNNNNVLHEMANLVRRMEEAQEKIHSDLQNLAQKTDLQNLAQKIEGVEAAVTDGRQSNLQDLTGLRSEFAQKIEVVRAAVVESKNSNAQDFAGLRSELLNVKQSVATQQDGNHAHAHVNDVTTINDRIADLASELQSVKNNGGQSYAKIEDLIQRFEGLHTARIDALNATVTQLAQDKNAPNLQAAQSMDALRETMTEEIRGSIDALRKTIEQNRLQEKENLLAQMGAYVAQKEAQKEAEEAENAQKEAENENDGIHDGIHVAKAGAPKGAPKDDRVYARNNAEKADNGAPAPKIAEDDEDDDSDLEYDYYFDHDPDDEDAKNAKDARLENAGADENKENVAAAAPSREIFSPARGGLTKVLQYDASGLICGMQLMKSKYEDDNDATAVANQPNNDATAVANQPKKRRGKKDKIGGGGW